jgi:hypothetical protein
MQKDCRTLILSRSIFPRDRRKKKEEIETENRKQKREKRKEKRRKKKEGRGKREERNEKRDKRSEEREKMEDGRGRRERGSEGSLKSFDSFLVSQFRHLVKFHFQVQIQVQVQVRIQMLADWIKDCRASPHFSQLFAFEAHRENKELRTRDRNDKI